MAQDVRKETSNVQTLKELEEVIALYKKQSPTKAALKEKNGDFDRQREALKGKK